MAKVRVGEVQDLSPEAVMGEAGAEGGVTPSDLPSEVPNVFGGEETAKEFLEYICSEIIDVRDGADRKDLEERWNRWRRMREAIPETEQRDTPWIQAANVEPPLMMQKVHTIFAKLIAAFSVKKPPVQVEALNENERDIADSLERFFKGLADNRYSLDVKRRFKQIAYDLVSLGTVPVKVPFKSERWAFKRTDATGTEQVTYVRKEGPDIVPIQLEDFFTRPYWKDVQRAPWVAVRYRYFYHELKQMESQMVLENVDKILGEAVTEYNDNLEEAFDRAGISTGSLGQTQANQEFEIYEAHVYWDVDGDGIPEDVIVWIEPDSMTLLRAQFNPLSVRDIEVFTYLENPNTLYGIGVCQMTEGPQSEVTALHRMRLDGTQLAMLKMFLVKRGAGIGPKETFEPFKMLFVDDPTADFRPIEFLDISQGAIIGEQMAQEYADRVTGANDYMAGFNDKTVGSNATVGGTTFLAGQANSILNSLLENTEQSMSVVYMLALYQMIANKDLVKLDWMDLGDAANIQQVLGMSVEDLPTKFRFTVRTTDINKTDESRKQNFLMVSQLYNQFGQTALQTLMMKINPQMAQMAEVQELLTSMYVGQTALMARMLEFFDVGNPEDFLPFTDQLKLQLRMVDKVRKEQTVQMKEAMNGQGQGIGVGGTAGLPTELGGGFGGIPGVAPGGAEMAVMAAGQGAGVPGQMQGPGGTGPNPGQV